MDNHSMVPFAAFEAAEERADRRDRRHWIGHIVELAIIVLMAALFMKKDLEMLHRLCEIITEKLAECERNLSASKDMSVSDIEIINKLTHALKSVTTTIAMMEAQEEEGGMSRRYYPMSYEGGMSGRRMSRDGGSYDNGGGSYDGSYDGGMSNRRGRSPSTGRYVSREGGYSGHDSLEDIMEDIRDMPEGEKKRLKQMLERM